MHLPQQITQTILTILIFSLLAACSPAQASPSPTAPPPAAAATHIPAPSETSAPKASKPPTAILPTLAPTVTPAPSETPSATPGPTPEAVTDLTVRWVDVYARPGEGYPVLAAFAENLRFIMTGRNVAGEWLQVELSPEVMGWISSSSIELAGEGGVLAVVDLPAASFLEAPALAELPLAATPARLATVTPDPGPPLILEVRLVTNPWTKSQVFEVKVHSREPYTRINILVNDAQGRTIVRNARSTDGGGDTAITFGSGLVTDGTYTVVVTDSFGNTVKKSVVVTGWHKPTPTPEK